jgi:cation diffusion facilitator family transporter
MSNTSEGAYKLRALKLSTVMIASVVIVEVILGLMVNSLAILSDGLHALLDFVTGVAIFVATAASLKPPDEEHTYGHEKFETIGGLIGGIALLGAALFIISEALTRLVEGVGVREGIEIAGFVAIGYALCVAFLRVAVFREIRNSESATIKAGFYHALADVSSTIIAFLGFGVFGFYQGDAVASIFLGIMLSYLSIKLARNSIMELSDAASKGLVQKIKSEILSNEGILKCTNLKARKVSSKIFIETTVQVSSALNLEDAHSLVSKIEAKLTEIFGSVNATIHIEPSEKETEIKRIVEKLAVVEGVKAVHNITTVYVGGKLYITLHAYVDPQLSVEKAHAIAEKIENNMQAGVNQLENATVHVEPHGAEIQASEIDENMLRDIIRRFIKDTMPNFYMKRITTYTSEGRCYVNLDCCFTKEVPITEAHDVASRIEHEIEEHLPNAVVTIHIEPKCT